MSGVYDEKPTMFQSSVRINVGPNDFLGGVGVGGPRFQSSVRINVGPNAIKPSSWSRNGGRFNPP